MAISDRTWQYVLTVGMLVTGTINTLSKRAQNQSKSVGQDGTKRKFSKPWTQSLIMFMGEMLVLGYFYFTKWNERRKQQALAQNDFRDLSSPLLTVSTDSATNNASTAANGVSSSPSSNLSIQEAGGDTPPKPQPVPTSLFLFALPSFFDLLGTTLAGIGLLYVEASVWQMLRGSIVIFSGIFSVLFLKRKFYAHNWIGIFITTCGLSIVGTASLLADDKSSDDENSGKVGFGYLMIILGQLCNSVQMIIEEKYLKQRNLEAPQVVGMEGLWGVILMMAIALPAVYLIPGDDQGSYENAVDAAHMIGNNGTLLAMVLLYFTSIAFYNFFGLSVAKYLSTIHRTLIDGMRTTFVWAVDLLIFYGFGAHEFGEKWTDYSYMQAAGFVVLILGTLVYNKVVMLPGIQYPPPNPTPASSEKK